MDPIDLILNFRDRNDSTILMWASYHKMNELVELCLSLGVNKKHKNRLGSDALSWAMDRENNEHIIKLLR
jgi:ankyrin repeat protein